MSDTPPDPAAVARLGAAMGLDETEIYALRKRLSSLELIDSGQIAQKFDVGVQSVRLWRAETNGEIAAGNKPRPHMLVLPVNPGAYSPQYVDWEVELWGRQSERVLVTGEPNKERPRGGRIAGTVHKQERQQVVDMYHNLTSKGMDPAAARNQIITELGVGRTKVNGYLRAEGATRQGAVGRPRSRKE